MPCTSSMEGLSLLEGNVREREREKCQHTACIGLSRPGNDSTVSQIQYCTILFSEHFTALYWLSNLNKTE